MSEELTAGKAADMMMPADDDQEQTAAARKRQVFRLPPPLGQVMIMAPGLLRTLHQLNLDASEIYHRPEGEQILPGMQDHMQVWWNADNTLGVLHTLRSRDLWQLSMRPWLHYLIVQAGEAVLLHFERYDCLPSENEPPLQLRIARAALRRDLGYKSNNDVMLMRMTRQAADLLGSLYFITRERLADGGSGRFVFPVITAYEYAGGKQGGLCCDIAPQFGQYLLQSGCLTCRKPRGYHFDTRAWRLRGMGSGRKGSMAFGLYMAACNIWNGCQMQHNGHERQLSDTSPLSCNISGRRERMKSRTCFRYSRQTLEQQIPELPWLRHNRGPAAAARQLRQMIDELNEMQLIVHGCPGPDDSLELQLSKL